MKYLLIPEGFKIYNAATPFEGTLEEAQQAAHQMAAKIPHGVYNIQTDEKLPVQRIIICEVVSELVSDWKIVQVSQ